MKLFELFYYYYYLFYGETDRGREREREREREKGGGGVGCRGKRICLDPMAAPQTVEQCLIATYAWTLR